LRNRREKERERSSNPVEGRFAEEEGVGRLLAGSV
jgi:hypothetical protein